MTGAPAAQTLGPAGQPVPTATVTGQQTVTIHGPLAALLHLRPARHTLTGAVEGTQRQRSCWVPELGMIADDNHDVQGTHQGVRFEGPAYRPKAAGGPLS
jgi:hypothetical protein